MRVIIIDVVNATCDLTGRENVECLRVQLDDSTPEIFCVSAELIKLLRLRKKQDGGKSLTRKECTVICNFIVDGVDRYSIDIRPGGPGLKLFALSYPANARGGSVSDHHLYASGEICVASGHEPRTIERAKAIAMSWSEAGPSISVAIRSLTVPSGSTSRANGRSSPLTSGACGAMSFTEPKGRHLRSSTCEHALCLAWRSCLRELSTKPTQVF